MATQVFVEHGSETFVLVREEPTALERKNGRGTPWAVYKVNSNGRGPKLDRDHYRNDIISRIKSGAYSEAGK